MIDRLEEKIINNETSTWSQKESEYNRTVNLK